MLVHGSSVCWYRRREGGRGRGREGEREREEGGEVQYVAVRLTLSSFVDKNTSPQPLAG